jgi:hypothetical protein
MANPASATALSTVTPAIAIHLSGGFKLTDLRGARPVR